MMVNCHLKPFAKLGLPVICIGFFMVNFALPCWSQEAPVFSLPTSEAGFARAYNDGVQAYRQQDFGTSEKLFQVARASTSNDLAAKAYYNLGNSRFEIALAKGSEIDIKRLEAATEAYRTCLAIDRGFHDARYNLEAALRLILDQNKKKESQEQESQEQESQEKDPKKQEPKENQEQKEQDKQEQDKHGEDKEHQEKEQPDKRDQPKDGESSKQKSDPKDEQEKPDSNPPNDDPQPSENPESKEETGTPENSGSPEKPEPGQGEPSEKEEAGKPSEDHSSSDDPTGELTDPPSNDSPSHQVTAAEEDSQSDAMTAQEAEKFLQSVRDRDLLRRLRREAAKHQRRVRVSRDW